MRDLMSLPTRDRQGRLRAVIEVPRGARVKIKYEPLDGAFEYARPLPLGVHYPYDWGFVPSTRCDDGDPLDVMVCHEARTTSGVVIPCRALGLVSLTQRSEGDAKRREHNDRVIAVPVDAPRLRGVDDLSERVRAELEEFFLSAVFFEHKDARIVGWRDAEAVEEVLRAAQARFERAQRIDAGGE